MRLPWRRTQSPHGWGTVPYHRSRVQYWRRSRYFWIVFTFWNAGWLVIESGTEWYQRLARVLYCVQLVFGTWSYLKALNHKLFHARMAWEIEANLVMQEMASSGMFTLTEAMESMAQNPPPDADPQDWQAFMRKVQSEMEGRS